MGNEARKHHWVPQCYLRGFTGDRTKLSKLYVVDGVDRKSFETQPANVAAERDFNRIEVDGQSPNTVESAYAVFEGQLTDALKRLDVSPSFVNQTDRTLVLNLLTLLAIRNPRMREKMRSARDQTARIAIDLATATKEGWRSTVTKAAASGYIDASNDLSYEQFRASIESDEYEVDVPTTEHVRMELMLIDSILPFIMARKWKLIVPGPDTGGFVTSDHPVVLKWLETSDMESGMPAGFGVAGTEVLFPVSRQLVLSGCFGGNEGTFTASQNIVAAINGMVITHAHRQVYALNDNFRYVIQEARGIRFGRDLLADMLELSTPSE